MSRQFYFYSNKVAPDHLRRRWYPSRQKLKYLIKSEKRKTLHSKLDQENLTHAVEEWKKTANVYFNTKELLHEFSLCISLLIIIEN